MDEYAEVANALGQRDSRKVANNSYLVRASGPDREGFQPTDGAIAYRLHNTYVVVYHADDSVELNSGGWRTVTTKDRINRALADYGPYGYRVWAANNQWKLYQGQEMVAEFKDHMVIRPDGTIEGAPTAQEVAARDKSNADLDKLIKRYLAGLTPEVIAKLDEQAGGDCWYCLMRGGEDQPLGDLTGNTEHLLSHLKERYYMRSLIINALEFVRVGDPWFVWALEVDYAAKKGQRRGSTVNHALHRYFKARLWKN